MERKATKIFIKALSVMLSVIMLLAVAVPCVAIAVGAEEQGISSLEPTYSWATTTRKYSFNDPDKKAANDAMLTDPAKYNGSKSFAEIYTIFKNEIKNNTNGYSFGTPSPSIGSVNDADWHDKSIKPDDLLPEVSKDHPRLLVTRDNIPTIRKALEEQNPTNERFFALLDMDVYQPRALNSDGSPADTVVNGKANGGINMGKLGAAKTDYFGRPGTHNYDGYYLEVIQVKALGYLIDGHELYGYQAIHCMKQLLRTLNIQKIDSNQEREFGNVMFTAALVYDWCYDLLDAEDKKQLMAGVENKVAKVTNDYGTAFSVKFPPTKLGAVSGHGSERQVLRDMLAASIAFHDENESWYNYIGTLVYEHYVPVRNYYFRSGISQQGVGTYVSGRHIADMFSAWILMTSTGTQPYENIDKTVRNFLGYETTPGKIYTDGDGGGTYQNNYEFRALAYMTAYMFEDEAMLAQARDMLPTRAFGSDKRIDLTIEIQSALYVALTGMSDIQPAADKYEGMPLIQYNGSPVGQYITHEKYGVTDSASVFMRIKERSTANHEHADAGSFMIYYKGMLTSDSGAYKGYGSDHTRYYHQATIAHNSLLIDNGSQNKSSTNNAIKYYSGGQIWPEEASDLATLKKETYHTGDVVGHSHAYYDAEKTQPHYAYINGNITGAYDSSTVDFVGRRMLVVYTGDETVPMAFFVYDRISSDSGAYKKTFLFHITSSKAPTIVASTKTMATENGDGRLVLTCLSDNVEIKGVGGRATASDGSYDSANSKNYYINGYGQVPAAYDDGCWGRVEITNTQNGSVVTGKTSSFMNAMYVTDAGNTTYYATKPVTNVTANIASAGDVEGGVFNNSIAAIFVKKNIKDSSSFNAKTIGFTTEGTDTLEYYVDGMEGGNWNVSVNGQHVTTATASNGLLTFEAASGDVVLTKESGEISTKKAELLETLGAKLSSDDYTAASYSEYSAAYDAIKTTINTAIDLDTLNAIDVAGLKASAEAKLVTLVSAKKDELKAALGAKKTNTNGIYSSESYTAYSNAYDAILKKINDASTMTALNEIDVATLKTVAEANLVSSIEDKRAALKSALGTKKSNSSGTYTSDSYSKYSAAFDKILSDINGATTLAALNAIDVAALKASAEANLVNAVDAKRAELIASLGAKRSSSGYTSASYAEYSAAYDAIISQINGATTLSDLNAINVATLKKNAEEKLITSTGSVVITTIGGSASTDLTLDYTIGTPVETIVYSIDIVWDDLSFTYDAGTTTWNPNTHAYDSAGDAASWSDAGGKVTVTNHSNAAIVVNVKCNTPSTANGTATLKASESQFTLNSAVGTAVANAPKKVITITAEGVPTSAASIGTLVITVSQS